MHPVPIELVISKMIEDRKRQEIDDRPQIELPLPLPPIEEPEQEAVSDEDENRGVIIIDIFGDDSEDII